MLYHIIVPCDLKNRYKAKKIKNYTIKKFFLIEWSWVKLYS